VWVWLTTVDGHGETTRPARIRVGRRETYHISSVLTIKSSLKIAMSLFIILYSKQNIDLITGRLWCPFHVKKQSWGKKFQFLLALDSRSSKENFQQGV